MGIDIRLVHSRLKEFNNQVVDVNTVTKMKNLINYDSNKFSNLDMLMSAIRKLTDDIEVVSDVLNIFEGYRRIITQFESCKLKIWVYADLGYTIDKMIKTEMESTFVKKTEDINIGSAIVRQDLLGNLLKYDGRTSTIVRC